MSKSNILVIGSLNMDWIINVHHTPIAGETIIGNFSQEVPGGKGANQAYTIGNLGGNVTMLGAVGTDLTGHKLLNNLEGVGVDSTHVLQCSDVGSGLALITVNEDKDNSIVVLPNANNKVTPEFIQSQKPLFEQAEIILLQMEIPHESVYAATRLGHELGKTIILNPAPAPRSIPTEILKMVDFITPNESELSILSGIQCQTLEGARLGAASLLLKGVKNVITTLGPQGALLVNQEGSIHFKGYPVQALDTTAAGDSFNGAIAFSLAEGKSINAAIDFGNRVASVTVTRVGAQSSIPSKEELGI